MGDSEQRRLARGKFLIGVDSGSELAPVRMPGAGFPEQQQRGARKAPLFPMRRSPDGVERQPRQLIKHDFRRTGHQRPHRGKIATSIGVAHHAGVIRGTVRRQRTRRGSQSDRRTSNP